jgi:TP901 family phage tail tape measure protein
MADVNANIGVNIDTSDALNQLKNLQRQISQFHQSVAKSSSAASIAQRDLQKNFVNGVNAIQGFSAELRTVRTSAESFTNSLEKNKFSIQQYFRYAASQTKTFGKNFTSEFATIEKTAIERVKTLQTQYIKMGRDANGAMQAIAIRPTILNMKDLGTQTAIAAQKQVLFNQLIKQGSTNLLNFGKNTQWAGRQLMVGFTLPLATLGMTAGRVFMDMEKAAIKFKKVYGDLFTAPEETQKAMDSITELGLAYTKYGVAVADSLSVAADAAAAGFQGVDLQNQTTASLKLSVLGQMELQKALETTIALQNAFRISSQDLVGEIDFLNAVENQTVVSLDDITEATPRVATVIQALGGDVRDLAFFLAAMKEGGVNAAQGANALKSGLASLINPTERASELLNGMGINIRAIVSQNQGDLRGTVVGFARALDTLDPMRRAQAIEQLFGKFQFARISALFDNVIREGSQASRVLDLAGASLGELAELSDKELGVSAASAMNKFRASIEQVKVALAPLGELFLEIATPFIDFATTVLKAFNNLPDGIKKIIGTVVTVVGGLGPVLLMTFGLINNGIANMIKFFATVRLGYLKMTGQAKGIGDETQYMTQEQLEAAAAAASLDQAHAGLTQRFTAEKTAVDALRTAYEQAAAAGARFATLNPGMMKPGSVAAPTKMAKGGVVTVGGRGNKDTEPALLTPGEAVIPAAMVKKYQPLIEGMIAGNIPGYAKGVMLGMPKSAKSVSKSRDAAEEIYQMFLKSSYAGTPPTEYGHQISPSSGHSFPIFSLGGVYQKGNKQVFVKPVLDEKAALAEMRSTEITRKAHGLEAPQQRIVVIRDPMDTTRTRRFLALESDLDPKFINNQPMGLFNEEQYFRQLVASLLRVDKDLSGSNVFGNVVADAGPAGVFNRASGLRDYQRGLPSMEDQALINLLGIKGGAKKAFAESTLGMMAGITPEQYRQRMLAEIQKVLPRLKETIASFKLTNPTEVGVYDDMVRRLEAGLGVDWSKFHAIHSAVKIPKPKAATQAIAGYKNGVVSVPGPKGAGDVTPAMLSPGEAVIPTAMAKKYAPLIQGMVAGNIPGYKNGTAAVGGRGSVTFNGQSYDTRGASENKIAEIINDLIKFNSKVEDVTEMLDRLEKGGKLTITSLQEAAKANDKIISQNPNKSETIVSAHLQGTSKILPSGERETGSFVRRMTQSQNKLLDEGGQYAEDFLKDWNKVSNPLIATVKLGGQEITDGIRKATDQIDDDIRDIAVAMANGQKITDEILEKAANEALARAKARGGDSALAANALERTKDMKVIKPATIGSLLDSEALKPLKESGVIVGKLAADELARKLKEIGWLTEGTGNARGDLVATEKGAALSSKGAGGRVFRTSSKGKFVAPERFAAEGMDKTYFNLDTSMAKLVDEVKDEVGEGLLNASASASPSEKTIRATNNMVDGVTETLVNSKNDVAQATDEMVSPVTGKRTVPRRSSTDPEVKDWLDNQVKTQATEDSANIAAGRSRGYRGASREGDLEARQRQAAATAGVVDVEALEAASGAQLQSLQKMSASISAVSFGLSSLTGILTAFGVDLGGVMPVISAVTGGLFALSGTVSALTQAEFAKKISKAVTLAGGFGPLFTQLKGGATGLKGIGNIIKSVGAQFKLMFPILSRLILPLAVVATLFAGWQIYNNIQEEAKRKLRGLSDAANMSSEKIKALGEAAGEQKILEKASFKTEDTTGTAPISGSDREQAKTFIENMGGAEEFANKYKNEIAAIKDAVGQQERLLATYQSMAIQFNALGMSEGAIEKVINALRSAAGEKDVVLDFKSLTVVGEDGVINTSVIEERAKNSVAAFEAAVKAEQERIQKEAATSLETSENMFYGAGSGAQSSFDPYNTQGAGANAESNRVQTETIAATTSELQSLRAAFQAGTISLEDYSAATSASIAPLSQIGDESKNLTALLTSMEVDPTFISSLTELSDKSAVLKAALAGVDLTQFQEGLKSKEAGVKAKTLIDLAEATRIATAAQEEANITTSYDEAVSPIQDEIRALEEQVAVKQDVIAVTGDTALAQRIAADESLRAAFIAAQAADVLAVANDGQATAVNQLFEDIKKLDSLKSQLGSAAGGGQKSPFQQAIDSLKEQRKEIKNSISAYAGLRSAGLSVAESSEIAKDSMLAAALASQQVGSRKWNELVTAIRSARAEEEAWLSSTPEGRAEQFSEVYSKVMDVFNAQEAILEMNNEAATAANRKIIETLEKQIEAYERRSSELQRDLDQIAEKEDEINKTYDEKTKALETVKKLNQDIINQQKSQLSIADALSRGDVSAAASAMQEARAESATAQGDAMGRALDASRQSQLDALTQNGKTRKEIEAEIKQIKKDVSAIEFGALQTARDAVTAADEALETSKETYTVQGQTKTQWEDIDAKINASKASASLYDAEVVKALENAKGLVGEWSKLQDTFTTTHVINTVSTGSGPSTTTTNEPKVGRAPSPIRGRGGALMPSFQASGGYISGPGTPTSDSIPAMLSDGEYVIKASSVNKFGQNFLDAINAGRLPGFKLGGIMKDGGGSSKPRPTPPKTPINIRAIERAAPIGKSANALVEFIKNPKTGYSSNLNKVQLESLVNKSTIPAGLEMYRTLTPGELGRIQQSISSGADYKPGQVRSFAGSSDLQTLGDSMSSKGSTRFGGANDMARTIAQITAMENLKGIQNVNRFGNLSQLNQEGVLGPDTRYKLISQTPATATSPAMMRFGAFARAMGPAGFIPDIIEMMKVFGGTSDLLQKPQFQFAKGGLATNKFAMGGLVSPKYFAMGGLVSPKYFADGGMAQGTDTVPAMLTPGEFIVNKASTKRFAPLLEAINTESSRYSIPAGPEAPNEFLNRVYNMPERKFSSNEFLQPVYNVPAVNYSPVGGAMPLNNKEGSSPSLTALDNSVYNYSLSVNVEGTNASANDIANVVMNKIKTIDSQQVRRQVLR